MITTRLIRKLDPLPRGAGGSRGGSSCVPRASSSSAVRLPTLAVVGVGEAVMGVSVVLDSPDYGIEGLRCRCALLYGAFLFFAFSSATTGLCLELLGPGTCKLWPAERSQDAGFEQDCDRGEEAL